MWLKDVTTINNKQPIWELLIPHIWWFEGWFIIGLIRLNPQVHWSHPITSFLNSDFGWLNHYFSRSSWLQYINPINSYKFHKHQCSSVKPHEFTIVFASRSNWFEPHEIAWIHPFQPLNPMKPQWNHRNQWSNHCFCPVYPDLSGTSSWVSPSSQRTWWCWSVHLTGHWKPSTSSGVDFFLGGKRVNSTCGQNLHVWLF